MASRTPGQLCVTRLGFDWIDGGTSCRWRSETPPPTGLAAGVIHPHDLTRAVASLERYALERYATTATSGQPARTPAIAVERFTGTGPNAQVGPGLSNMLTTSLGGIEKPFKPALVEWGRRADLQREIDQSNSPAADPSTRITKQWIEPDFFVRGSVMTTDTTTTWSISLVDATTGEVVWSESRTAIDKAVLDAPDGIAERLVSQLHDHWTKQQRDAQRTETPGGETRGRRP